MFTYLIPLTFFISCSNSNSNDSISCNKERAITGFPKEYEIKEDSSISANITQCVDMFHADSLLICKMENSEHFWRVISLNSMKTLCELIPKGHGNNDFSKFPTSEITFIENDSLYVNFFDKDKNAIVKGNLTKSVKLNKTIVSSKKINTSEDICNIYEIKDSTYFIVKNKSNRGFTRELLQKDVLTPVSPGNLNDVLANEELNILSATRTVNPQKTTIVEAMLRFNQINLYSIGNDFNVTLKMEPELQSVSKIENTIKPMRNKYFGTIYSAEKWFAVLYYNTSIKSFFEGDFKNSQIMFFDWSGNPLLKLKLSMQATSFFIYDQSLYLLIDNEDGRQIHKYKFPCPNL